MKKWIISMALIGSVMLLGGCSSNEVDIKHTDTQSVVANETETPAPTETPVAQEITSDIQEILPIKDENYLDGLNLFKQDTVSVSDGEIVIELYVGTEIDEAGELIIDDGQEWALIAVKGEEKYPLIERTYIQNGELNYTIYTDYDNNGKLHVLVENHSGAGISYYDCAYDEHGFTRDIIFEANNINVISKW